MMGKPGHTFETFDRVRNALQQACFAMETAPHPAVIPLLEILLYPSWEFLIQEFDADDVITSLSACSVGDIASIQYFSTAMQRFTKQLTFDIGEPDLFTIQDVSSIQLLPPNKTASKRIIGFVCREPCEDWYCESCNLQCTAQGDMCRIEPPLFFTQSKGRARCPKCQSNKHDLYGYARNDNAKFDVCQCTKCKTPLLIEQPFETFGEAHTLQCPKCRSSRAKCVREGVESYWECKQWGHTYSLVFKCILGDYLSKESHCEKCGCIKFLIMDYDVNFTVQSCGCGDLYEASGSDDEHDNLIAAINHKLSRKSLYTRKIFISALSSSCFNLVVISNARRMYDGIDFSSLDLTLKPELKAIDTNPLSNLYNSSISFLISDRDLVDSITNKQLL